MSGYCKILISSLDAYGHANACLGVGRILVERGHQVFFLNRVNHRGNTKNQGITFLPIEDFEKPGGNQIDGTIWTELTAKYAQKLEMSTLDRVKEIDSEQLNDTIRLMDNLKRIEYALRRAVDQIEPDIVLGDFLFTMPFLWNCEVPFVPIMSVSPLMLYNGPPYGSGLSVHEDPEKWKEYRDAEQKLFSEIEKLHSPWFHEYGLESPKFEEARIFTRHFGIYVYSEVLDYKELGNPPSNWIRLDAPIRLVKNLDFEIPENLRNRSGSLIFFSMGSIGSVLVSLMNRVLKTLSRCRHRIIVSKGPLGDQLALSENMWGENYVNQLAILPKVDLVIFHGGNNTFIETLSHGKPMIALPLFIDQLDNAQRLEDLNLGRRFDPVKYREDDLLSAIEDILMDRELHERLVTIAEAMKATDSKEKIGKLIERLARKGIDVVTN